MLQKVFTPIVGALIVAAAFGCGGSSSGGSKGGPPAAPAHPGDVVALVGTSWMDAESNTSYTFNEGGSLVAENPATDKPLTGSYSVEKGIVSMSVGLRTLEGTWDGTTLSVKGKKLTRK